MRADARIKVIRRMASHLQLPVNIYGKTIVRRKVRMIENFEVVLDNSTENLLQGQGNLHEGHERVRSESSDSDRKIVQR